MTYLSLIAPFIAGAFALAGAWIGLRAARNNEHEKWLRQARTEVFAKFLRVLHECENRLYTEKWAVKERSERINFIQKNLQPAYNEARVVRLFLSVDDRNKLFDYLREVEGGHYPGEDIILRHHGIDHIQSLLEAHLDCLQR
jgi:hypothetical protein